MNKSKNILENKTNWQVETLDKMYMLEAQNIVMEEYCPQELESKKKWPRRNLNPNIMLKDTAPNHH